MSKLPLWVKFLLVIALVDLFSIAISILNTLAFGEPGVHSESWGLFAALLLIVLPVCHIGLTAIYLPFELIRSHNFKPVFGGLINLIVIQALAFSLIFLLPMIFTGFDVSKLSTLILLFFSYLIFYLMALILIKYRTK